jgi:hypothetical protein
LTRDKGSKKNFFEFFFDFLKNFDFFFFEFYIPTIDWMVLPGLNTEKNIGQSQIGFIELKNGCFDDFFHHFRPFSATLLQFSISDIFGIVDPL